MINFYGGFCNIHIVFSVLPSAAVACFYAEKHKLFLETVIDVCCSGIKDNYRIM